MIKNVGSLPERQGAVRAEHRLDTSAPVRRRHKPLFVARSNGCSAGSLVRMCDKYIFYVYTCLRRGKVQLTDDERSYLFGGRSDVFAQIDPKWVAKFVVRCRVLYQGELKRCLSLSPLGMSDMYRARTGEGTYTTVDSGGHVVRIENFTDPRLPRKMTVGDSAFAVFEKTLSVFSNVAFRIQRGGARATPSLVICRRSDSHAALLAGLCSNWQTCCYAVKERDIRGLKVGSGYIYTTDGLSLYSLVASWKTDICLIFDDGCREETVRTLCALAIGDSKLGTEFKLKCVLPDGGKRLDLRDLDPLEPGSTPRDVYTPREIKLERLADEHSSSALGRRDREGLVSLRDMTRLPSGFSILAENDNVVVLRHILRDAVVIVPKRRAGMAKGARGTAPPRSGKVSAPSGYITEWFPCRYSLFRVERGLPGVPPAVISCNRDGDEDDGRRPKEDRSAGEVPTLRVLRSSEYHRVLPRGFRSSGHLFDQSVCLLPGTMYIVAPPVLRFAGCVAIMYAFDVFGQLSVDESERAASPVRLSFVSTLSLREAQALLLSYLCLRGPLVASEKSCFRLPVQRRSVLLELRKIVSANPRVHSGLAGLQLSGGEEVMREELEDEILRVRDELAGEGSREDADGEEESDEGEESEDSSEGEGEGEGEDEDEDDERRREDIRGDAEEGSEDAGEEESDGHSSDCESEDDTDAEDRVIANISRAVRAVPRNGQRTGHLVLFGRGRGCDSSFKWITIGLRTLGLVNLKILRACGAFYSKRGHSRAVLKIPNTNGVLPEPRWLGEPTLLTDDLCVIVPDKGPRAPPRPLLECSDCFFQLNYSPKTAKTTSDSGGAVADGVIAVEMSRIEQAICSENARGYEEQRLFRLFKTSRRKMRRCQFDVAVDDPAIGDPACKEPLYKRAWLGPQRRKPGSSAAPSTIGDGEFFPSIEIARESHLEESEEDMLSYPLSEYNLNLTIKSSPKRYSMVRADRPRGECGSVYEACLDEAVLLGHCARVSVTRGAEKNFDVSACLTWFYRSVHPCVPDMNVGDVMLDYEFTLHGGGELSPVYALLSHLAESCRVNCFPVCKLITLSRHRGASVWTRGTDAPFHSQRLRTNTIGAFLCAQDHRLAPLLSRCCNPKPVQPCELWRGCELLPRGDEEELLLRAYSRTLGPVFEFEKVERFPSKVRTSLGDWTFMRLASRSCGVNRYPGTAVVDGYTIAFASESPLFHLRERGPLVQKLESAAVVVESGSLYRTDVLKKEDPEWPGPDPIDTRERIKCKSKSVVVDEMFMRSGGRDPLEGCVVNERSWDKVTSARWTFKKAPGGDQDWELEYPLSESLTATGGQGSNVATVKWLCAAPPACFSSGLKRSRGNRATERLAALGRVVIDSRTARIRDPAAWRGFDALCSRVLTCPTEKVWTRGVCKVVNKGLNAFERNALVPIANLIVIVEPGEWYASPCRDDDDDDRGEDTKRAAPVDDEALISHNEVCSASEFVAALASRMLSGEVHEELEIKCLRRGVYNYLQRALAWFAGATGPFRSRTVTVFTPEANSVTECWTHTLPPGLDALKTSSTGYLVSCKEPCGDREDVAVLLARSKGVIRVNSAGNLVLHSNPGTLKVSAMQGEPGVHAVIKTPVDSAKGGESDCAEVHVRCDRSLSEFCKLRCLPKGIRGPDTWTRPLPWSKRDPGSFCSKVSELKYRWESNRTDFAEAPARDSGGRFWHGEQPQEWKRCSDGKLIPRRERFWYLIDYKESFVRQNEPAEVVSSDESEPEFSDSDKESSHGEAYEESGSKGSEEEEEEEEEEKEEEEEEEEEETTEPVMVNCEWRERGVSSFLLLNSRLEIEFVPSLPRNEGHVFLEPVHNEDYRARARLDDDDGRLVKYYKPHKFFSLMHDVCTVLVYGCGLRPVFVQGSSDAAGDRVLSLVMGALALADRLSPDVYHPGHPKIVIVVREGREETLKLARKISRCIVVTTGRRKRAGALAYAFGELPHNLEREARSPRRTGNDKLAAHHYALPEKFVGDTGVSAFAQLTALWPAVSKRSDVKHPACSRDPRWIGLMVCLAEWAGQRQIADAVAPGALEALRSSLAKARECQRE